MIIECTNTTKKYLNGTIGLNQISLSIDKGLFGLLGKNGSGKTTLMRILTTLMEPTQGQVKILDMPINKANKKVIQQNIGYLPQEFGFYKEFTVYEILEYICILREINKGEQSQLIREALEKVNLYQERQKKYKELSGGMKRRVGLAQAILQNPAILIVDEPTVGVDPEERIKIRRLLTEYAQDNTVLFSTHIIEDIEYTCDKLAILDGGNLLFEGELSTLLKQARGKVFECMFQTLDEFKAFEVQYKVISIKRDGTGIKAIYLDEKGTWPKGKMIEPTLEEAYVYMTTKGRCD